MMKILKFSFIGIALFVLVFLRPSPLISGFIVALLFTQFLARGSAKQSKEVQNISDFPSIINDICDLILEQGWKIRKRSSNEIVATTSASSCSWGEKITLSYVNERLIIESRCRFPIQSNDWGKNVRNIDVIANHIEAKPESEKGARPPNSSLSD